MSGKRDEKLDAEVYKSAARMVEQMDDYSCNKVAKSAGYERPQKHVVAYERMFIPGQVWDEHPEHQQGIRVLMLCFMAAMVEAGDA